MKNTRSVNDLGACRSGFATGCEARLCLAVNAVKAVPSVRALPKIARAQP